MLIRRPDPIRYSEVTPQSLFLSRRTMLAQVSVAVLGTQIASAKLPALKKSGYSVSESPNKPDDVTRYNNFYEFGTQKSDPAENAKNFRTSPWTLSVEGVVGKPQKFSMDDILKVAPLEERIYRFRCVEGWSAIIPWAGFPLQELIKRVEPTSKAKYVAFETYYDAKQMPQARGSGIQFPYVEGLRLDEAMHPLTLLTVGMYGDSLPPQNGAPVRLIVPWKYGFKSAKSLVKIRLVEKQPPTSWNLLGPQEYGFYSNVNPAVAHPRWSQATERRLGEFGRRKTLPFNGYADQVASLYQGLDLVKNY